MIKTRDDSNIIKSFEQIIKRLTIKLNILQIVNLFDIL